MRGLRMLTGAVWLLAAGCAQRIDWTASPDLRLGVDPCDECHMLINDARYAAMIRLVDGSVRRFDDLVCLKRHRTSSPAEIAQYWLCDWASGSWIRETQAHLVSAPAIETPMGGGMIAFADAVTADRAAADYGVEPQPASAVFPPAGR